MYPFVFLEAKKAKLYALKAKKKRSAIKRNLNIEAGTQDTAGFWCQAIHKKFLQRFDTSFDIKMMMKIYAIKVIFKSHEPFQSYQLK